MRIAVIPDRGAVRRRRRDRHELQIVRGDRFLHLLAGQLGERQARLMRRPQIQRERQLHGALEIRRQRNLGRGKMRCGLADKGRDLDLRAAPVIDIAIIVVSVASFMFKVWR